MASFAQSKAKATALRARVKAIQEELEKSEATLVALARPFIPDPEEDEEREPLSDSLVAPGEWDCTDGRNPVGTCVYDDENDECHDYCLFCGSPEERY